MANNPEYQPGVKLPMVKAAFDLELAKRNYQQLLQNLSSVTITRENINEDLTKDGREVLKLIVDEKDRQSAEPLQWHRDIMHQFKSVHDPIKAELDRIANERKAVALQMQEEENKQKAEQLRISTAQSAIVTFCNGVALRISQAKTDSDIVMIEKMIGLEKTKKSIYQEFLPDLINQLDGLRPQIKEQKESIRELQKIAEQEKLALETGDIQTATDLKDKKEYYEQEIAERGIRIHEKAFEQAATIEILVPEVVEVAPKGRSNWKWKVYDMKLLEKKMPHMVKKIPNDELIEAQLSTMKKDGSLNGCEETNWNGITFYNDKSFKR